MRSLRRELARDLAVLGVLVGSVFVGSCMVICAREHWSRMSARVRRFVRPQRDDVDPDPLVPVSDLR